MCMGVCICAEICGMCPKVQQFEFLEDPGIGKETSVRRGITTLINKEEGAVVPLMLH